MPEQNLVEQLRQPLNNIGLAAANIEDYLHQEGKLDITVGKLLRVITNNVKRADAELLAAYRDGHIR